MAAVAPWEVWEENWGESGWEERALFCSIGLSYLLTHSLVVLGRRKLSWFSALS